MRVLLDRFCGKPTGYIHHIAILLNTVAKHYVNSDKKTNAGFRKLCSNLDLGRRGLTEKNKRFLRRFADVHKLAAPLELPRRLFAEAGHIGGDCRQDAVGVRHLAAKLYLDRRPGDYETVRRLLGHKDIATTMRFYRELDTVLAVKRYGGLVTQLIQDLETRTAPKQRSGRRERGG